MGDQVPDSGPAGRRAQPRRVPIEALQHLDLGELRTVGVDRRVKVEAALFHQLQRGHRDDHLGHRHDGELGAGRDLTVLAGHARPEAGLVKHAIGIRGDRGNVRYRAGVHSVLEHPVNRRTVYRPAHRPASLASSAR